MLTYVPVLFAEYKMLKHYTYATLQYLIAHADRDGVCYPSLRHIARELGLTKSTISRHMDLLEEAGAFTRRRRGPGRSYEYRITARFLPAAVSRGRNPGVPPARTEENTPKKTEARGRAKSTDQDKKEGELLDERARWERRVKTWHYSGGKFWNAFWGPKPGEAGCFVPAGLL